MLAEVSVVGSNELVEQYYLWGNYIDEALLKVDTHGTAATTDDEDHYYLPDHLYSNVAAVDYVTETVAERYEYDAYGKAQSMMLIIALLLVPPQLSATITSSPAVATTQRLATTTTATATTAKT